MPNAFGIELCMAHPFIPTRDETRQCNDEQLSYVWHRVVIQSVCV